MRERYSTGLSIRAIAYKYRESYDRKENSDFLLLRQKDPFDELFSEMYLQSSSEFTQPRWPDGIYPKLYIFNTPVQKEGNLHGFHIHTVCNLPFRHSSEIKAILK